VVEDDEKEEFPLSTASLYLFYMGMKGRRGGSFAAANQIAAGSH
jgi:hypothetical protein